MHTQSTMLNCISFSDFPSKHFFKKNPIFSDFPCKVFWKIFGKIFRFVISGPKLAVVWNSKKRVNLCFYQILFLQKLSHLEGKKTTKVYFYLGFCLTLIWMHINGIASHVCELCNKFFHSCLDNLCRYLSFHIDLCDNKWFA